MTGDEAKRIACIDLNGVLDAYTGWQGPAHFDRPREGAREFLEALRAGGFQINTAPSLTRPPAGELMLEVQSRAVAALLHLSERFPDHRMRRSYG